MNGGAPRPIGLNETGPLSLPAGISATVERANRDIAEQAPIVSRQARQAKT
jgi:hypothetical protein